MTILVNTALAALTFSSALLALRSLRVLYLELSERDGRSDRRTILIAGAMLALAIAALRFLAPMVVAAF